MRNAAVLLALICSTSINAQTLKMQNEAGGEIVLTLNQCTADNGRYPSLYSVYGYARNGVTIRGCWAHIDGLIRVIWIEGGRREEATYRMEDFTYHPKGQ